MNKNKELFCEAYMTEHDLAQNIEALLFALGGPISRKELAGMLNISTDELAEGIKALRAAQTNRGVQCVDDGKTVELRAAPEAAEIIERVRKEEFDREIGRAGSETLAAVLYRGPLTRSEIDFIRGVNSSQTLRTLLMRGFVRRIPNPNDERSFLYEPTTELLAELGVTHPDELPEFQEVKSRLAELETAYKTKESEA